MHELRSLFGTLVALSIIILAFSIMPGFFEPAPAPFLSSVATGTLPAIVASAPLPSTPSGVTTTPATTTETNSTAIIKADTKTQENTENKQQNSAPSNQAVRIENPYNTAPLPFETINLNARAALVNIFCTPHGGSLSPISGSGVVIDPRGIILTNAHVAQYVLLSESSRVNLTCSARTGAPAAPSYQVSVLYLPEAWVDDHAKDIVTLHPTGTGEHDWALLRASGPLPSGTVPFPTLFPYISFDTRAGIAFMDDQVLAAAYPAEFVGGIIAQMGLYPVSSISKIDQLLTFSSSTIDLISIGSVVEAQSGSSGGPVVNQWGKLVGIITTTSEGATTGQRNLRAITLNYIDRDTTDQTGLTLSQFLQRDPLEEQYWFDTTTAPRLIDQYIRYLTR